MQKQSLYFKIKPTHIAKIVHLKVQNVNISLYSTLEAMQIFEILSKKDNAMTKVILTKKDIFTTKKRGFVSNLKKEAYSLICKDFAFRITRSTVYHHIQASKIQKYFR